MKFVKRYEYDYINNCSRSFEDFKTPDPQKFKDCDTICMIAYDPKGKEIEKRYFIKGKEYLAIDSGFGITLHNLFIDGENGKYKKFEYKGYAPRRIIDTNETILDTNLSVRKDGTVDLFEVAPRRGGPQDIYIHIQSGYYARLIDNAHAYKYHVEHKNNPDYENIIDIIPVIDEMYTCMYSDINDSIFFISETEDEKTIIDLQNHTIRTVQKEKTNTRNPFLKYSITNIDIELDEYCEPVQIDGIYTKETSDSIFNVYKYKAYNILPDDYKYGSELYYVDTLILDKDLDIESKFIRDIYIIDQT